MSYTMNNIKIKEYNRLVHDKFFNKLFEEGNGCTIKILSKDEIVEQLCKLLSIYADKLENSKNKLEFLENLAEIYIIVDKLITDESNKSSQITSIVTNIINTMGRYNQGYFIKDIISYNKEMYLTDNESTTVY